MATKLSVKEEKQRSVGLDTNCFVSHESWQVRVRTPTMAFLFSSLSPPGHALVKQVKSKVQAVELDTLVSNPGTSVHLAV